jgi:hypothetical protein
VSAPRKHYAGIAWISWEHRLLAEGRSPRLIEYFKEDRTYHEAQQQMVDRYFQEIYRPESITDPLFVWVRKGGRIAQG